MKRLLVITLFLLFITGCNDNSKIEESVAKISKNIEYLTEKEKAKNKGHEDKVSTGEINTRLERNHFLQPASRLKEISEKTTEQVRKDFMATEKTRRAYEEVNRYIAEQLITLAEEGFYKITYITITEIKNKNFMYNSLSDKNKDVLESLLKEDLIALGYSVKSLKHDDIGLDWAITWN